MGDAKNMDYIVGRKKDMKMDFLSGLETTSAPVYLALYAPISER